MADTFTNEIQAELVVDLDNPIVIDGISYAALTLHEPTADMVLKAQSALVPGAAFGSERSYLISLVAACAGVPREVVLQTPIRKQNQAARYCQSFIESDTPFIDQNDMPDELIIEIDPPIKVNGGFFDEVTLREPTADMVQKAEALLKPGSGVEVVTAYNIMLVALSSKVSRSAVGKMPIRKLNYAAKYLSIFIASV